jgi:DUF1707 SHOCT-like domain
VSSSPASPRLVRLRSEPSQDGLDAAGDGGRPEPRATDRDRETTAVQIQEATGRGQLTLAEASDRLGVVYAARHRRELDGLVADLPPEHPTVPTALGWPVLIMMTRLQLRETAQEAARRNRLARVAVSHPRLAAAALVMLMAGLAVLTLMLFGHEHHWYGHRFGGGSFEIDQ